MGCDGGTIPRRDELVKVKKKPQAAEHNKDFELAYRWRFCHLSQQMLQPPIVMCEYGYLYSKTLLIEGLLNRATVPDNVRHIRNLKHVKNLNLTPNPEYKSNDEQKQGGVDFGAAPYICPVTGMEMTGKFRFVGLWSCGCVFSERALKEVSTYICHKCQAPFAEEDVIIINGNEEDIKLMGNKRKMRLLKNKQKEKVTTRESEVVQDRSSAPIPINHSTQGQLSIKTQGAINISKNRIKKLRHNYSVAEDPQASDVYKSLFTSHQSEQQQTRAHWITYNPFYN